MGKQRPFATILFCSAIVLLLSGVIGVAPLTERAVAEGSGPNGGDLDSCQSDTATVAEPLRTGEEINILEIIKLLIL